MSNLKVLMPKDSNGSSIPVLGFGPTHEVTVGPTNTVATSAFPADVRVVRLVSTVACRVATGETPDATNGAYLPANCVEYIKVNELGTSDKVAAIQLAAGGTLYATEMK